MSAKIYIEGGGESKDLQTRCRAGFRRLFEKCGFGGRMPQLVACGGRGATFDDFLTAHANAGAGDYVAMLVDSEDPVADIEQTWTHLKHRDGWDRPHGADGDQVLLMTTCMETWIAADRQVLINRYGPRLLHNTLPALNDMESRTRDSVQSALAQATRNCQPRYSKGKESFELVARLDPAVLRQHLRSFVRCERVLNEKL